MNLYKDDLIIRRRGKVNRISFKEMAIFDKKSFLFTIFYPSPKYIPSIIVKINKT
jgi:hypothetical protein